MSAKRVGNPIEAKKRSAPPKNFAVWSRHQPSSERIDRVAAEVHGEEKFGLFGSGGGEVGNVADEQADLGEELLAGGKQGGLLDGSEPEGAPVCDDN